MIGGNFPCPQCADPNCTGLHFVIEDNWRSNPPAKLEDWLRDNGVQMRLELDTRETMAAFEVRLMEALTATGRSLSVRRSLDERELHVTLWPGKAHP